MEKSSPFDKQACDSPLVLNATQELQLPQPAGCWGQIPFLEVRIRSPGSRAAGPAPAHKLRSVIPTVAAPRAPMAETVHGEWDGTGTRLPAAEPQGPHLRQGGGQNVTNIKNGAPTGAPGKSLSSCSCRAGVQQQGHPLLASCQSPSRRCHKPRWNGDGGKA